jgi:hypothetical protein
MLSQLDCLIIIVDNHLFLVVKRKKGDQMSSTSRIRRWWTEEEDRVLRREADFQRKCIAKGLISQSLGLMTKPFQ